MGPTMVWNKMSGVMSQSVVAKNSVCSATKGGEDIGVLNDGDKEMGTEYGNHVLRGCKRGRFSAVMGAIIRGVGMIVFAIEVVGLDRH